MSETDWASYVTSDQYEQDKLDESIHALKFEIFGVDHAGKNSYIYLRRQMRKLKLNFTDGVRKYSQRMMDYQTYLPDMLWESGERQGEKLGAYPDKEMREIITDSMTRTHLEQLLHVGWDPLEKPFNETVAKIASLEPQIIQTHQHEKRLEALEKDQNPTNNRKGKNNKRTATGESTNTNAPPKKCEICKKTHRGECWFADKNDKTKGRDKDRPSKKQ